MDAEAIRELFANFGAVEIRRLFGGAGLFADGVMFGLVSGGEIFLKTDTEGTAAFAREGCHPFEYGTRHGRRALRSYWRLPERLYDDGEELAGWAARALAVAQRSRVPAASKRRRQSKSPTKKKRRRRSA